MIITCQNLLSIFRLIYYEESYDETIKPGSNFQGRKPGSNFQEHSNRSFQIRFCDDQVEFSILYDINVYISVTLDRRSIVPNELGSVVPNELNLGSVVPNEQDDIYLEEQYFHKLYLYSKYYPNNIIDIKLDSEYVSVSVIEGPVKKTLLQRHLETESAQLEFFVENIPDSVVVPPDRKSVV